jgi:hypothetical protein
MSVDDGFWPSFLTAAISADSTAQLLANPVTSALGLPFGHLSDQGVPACHLSQT